MHTWFERDFSWEGRNGTLKVRGFAGVRDSPSLPSIARGLGAGDIGGRIYF
jgi:hypothetical protein